MKQQQRSCTICKAPFTFVTKPGRPPATCSPTCTATARTTADRYCSLPHCQQPFTLDDANAAPPYFCSQQCRTQSKAPSVLCAHCRTPLVLEMSRIRKNNFCSLACITTASEQSKCIVCEKPVRVLPEPPWWRVQRYCSAACRTQRMDMHQFRELRNEDASLLASPAYHQELQLLAPQNHGGVLYALPHHSHGVPYTTFVPTDELTQALSPAIQHGITFREAQIRRIVADHPTETGLHLHLAGAAIHTHTKWHWPVSPSHPHYLPSLAEIYPWLSAEAVALLRQNNWQQWQRLYTRAWKGNPSGNQTLEMKIRELRDAMLHDSTPDLPPNNTLTYDKRTRDMRALHELCHQYRSKGPPAPADYLTGPIANRCTWATGPGDPADLMQFLMDEERAYKRTCTTEDPWTSPGRGMAVYRYVMDTRKVDTVQFTYWMQHVSLDRDGFARAWVSGNRNFTADDC